MTSMDEKDDDKLDLDFGFGVLRHLHRLAVTVTVVVGSLIVFGVGFFFWFVIKLMAHFSVL